jgi:hypothetical protein
MRSTVLLLAVYASNVGESSTLLSLEVAGDLLTASVGVVMILLLLRVEPLLFLSRRMRFLWSAVGYLALILIVISQVAEVLAAFSRVSTTEDLIGEGTVLIALCFVAFALYLRNREEQKGLFGLEERGPC